MNKKGVTLVELIVVLVIIGIAAALTIPGIGRWLPGYHLRGATRDVVSIMRMAQAKAVSGNMEYRVNFDVAQGSYILQCQTTAGLVNDGDWQKLRSGVQFKEVNFGGGDPNAAIFNANSTSSGGNVTLRNTKGTEKRISLSSTTGRVQVPGN